MADDPDPVHGPSSPPLSERLASTERERAEALGQLAAATREIDELRRQLISSAERETSLQGELQHRVRNILAIVRSVFSRTVSGHDMLEDAANHFRGRLDAIARYQSRSARGLGRREDIEEMVRGELLFAGSEGDPRISVEGPTAYLNDTAAESFGLALHELVTNSIKFGVLSQVIDRGRLHIEWQLTRGSLVLGWRETGITIISAAPLPVGFGREFIEQSMPYQCDAKTKFEIRPGQLTCVIAIPLAEKQPFDNADTGTESDFKS